MEEDIDTEVSYKCVPKVISRYTSMKQLNVRIDKCNVEYVDLDTKLNGKR